MRIDVLYCYRPLPLRACLAVCAGTALIRTLQSVAPSPKDAARFTSQGAQAIQQ